MPIEDPNSIDIITRPPGQLALLITDSGQTRDPETRLTMFRAKLETYVRYVENPEFTKTHAVARDQVLIVLVSQLEATPEMKGITSVSLAEGGIRLPVIFDRFDEESQ
jgi:hypothetical protein